MELRAEGVVAEPLGQGEVSLIVYAAAAQVRADGSEPGQRQPFGQRGKHSPVLEALEAVQHQNRRARRGPSPGANVYQDGAQSTGQRVFRKSGRGHGSMDPGEDQVTAASSSSTFARIGVEPSPDTEGHGPLRIDVPDGEPVGDWDAQRRKIGGEHLVEAERAVPAGPFQPGEPADHHSGQAAKRPDQPEMGKHAINPVEVLAHVFEEQYGAGELWKVGRTDQALEQGEIPARQWTLGHAAAQGDDPVLLGHEHGGRLGDAAQAARRFGRVSTRSKCQRLKAGMLARATGP